MFTRALYEILPPWRPSNSKCSPPICIFPSICTRPLVCPLSNPKPPPQSTTTTVNNFFSFSFRTVYITDRALLFRCPTYQLHTCKHDSSNHLRTVSLSLYIIFLFHVRKLHWLLRLILQRIVFARRLCRIPEFALDCDVESATRPTSRGLFREQYYFELDDSSNELFCYAILVFS